MVNVAQEPLGFRRADFSPRYRYSCLHFLFRTLQHDSRHTFYAVRNAPLPSVSLRSLGFGGGLDARSSSTQFRSTSELLRTL